MNTIPLHSTVSLRFSPLPALLPPLLGYCRELARCLGFPDDEGARIELALEEALGALVDDAPDPDATVLVEFCRVPLGLRVRIGGYDRPRSREELSAYVPGTDPDLGGSRGLEFFLLQRLVDQVSLVDREPGSQELHFFKRLPGALPHLLQEAGPRPRKGSRARHTSRGPLRPPASTAREDAALLPEIRRLMPSEESKGMALPSDLGMLQELLRDTEAAIFAARDAEGTLLAFQVVERYPHRRSLAVAHPPVVASDADFPQCGAALREAVCGHAAASGAGGVLLAAVAEEAGGPTVPPGFGVCALLPALPGTALWRGLLPSPRLLLFRPLGPETSRERLHLPPARRPLLLALYRTWRPSVLTPEFAAGERFPPYQKHSMLSAILDRQGSSCDIFVHQYGLDFPLRLRSFTEEARHRKTSHLMLHLPLEAPSTAWEAEEAEKLGYALCGVLPGTPRGDELLYLHRQSLPHVLAAAGSGAPEARELVSSLSKPQGYAPLPSEGYTPEARAPIIRKAPEGGPLEGLF